MITFLSVYWGPLLFFAVMAFLLAQGVRFAVKYRTWKPFWFFFGLVACLTIATMLLVSACMGGGS